MALKPGLRSSSESWLLGASISQLSAGRLPRGLDVLRLLQFHHVTEKKTLAESYRITCCEVIEVWNRARLPTQRPDACVRKLKKLHERYLKLKKNRKRDNDTGEMNNDLFLSDLEELFDVATANALSEIVISADRDFLERQRESVFSSSMAGADLVIHSREENTRKRDENEDLARQRYAERESRKLKVTESEPLSSTSGESESESPEDEYIAPSTSSETPGCSKTEAHSATSSNPKPKNIFRSPDVVAALDRVNLPDRGAVFVAGAVAKALGHDIGDITLSRRSVRRSRMEGRREAAAAEEDDFSLKGPLLLHWDGKLLPDIDGSKKNVDRIAVLVTGNGEEKLLGVPKATSGTGEQQATACIDCIEKWGVKDQVHGIVFDTTSSNTGLHRGACIRLENYMEREIVWVACRHHMHEIVLSHAYACTFGGTSGPDDLLFKRFQKKWADLDHNQYDVCTVFDDPVLAELRVEMLDYLPIAITQQQPRDDYLELLKISLLFLGGDADAGSFRFRAPGAMHHARWMAKGIYAIKIYLFRHQFKLTKKESKNILDFALFVSLAYVKYWNEAPIGVRAPYNDIQFMNVLKRYPDRKLSDKTVKAFSNHLWYLSEHLVGFAFFDDRVTEETKSKMVTNLSRPKAVEYHRPIPPSDMIAGPEQIPGLVTE